MDRPSYRRLDRDVDVYILFSYLFFATVKKLYYSGIFFSIKNPFATAWFVTSPTRPTAVVRCIIIVTAIITITIIILIHCLVISARRIKNVRRRWPTRYTFLKGIENCLQTNVLTLIFVHYISRES